MRFKAYRAGALIAISMLAWNLPAGTVVQQQGTAPGSNQPPQMVTLSVDSGKLRVEGSNPTGGSFLVIFDQAKQVTWIVNQTQGTYMEMTAADVQKMADQMQNVSGQMQQAMQQMEAQMANMPPEQRAQMEQMMKQHMGAMGGMGAAGGGGAAPQITVQQKSSGEKVGQFTCTRYDVLSNGQLSQQLCAASPDQLKIDSSAFDTFKALAAFYEPLRRSMPQQASGWAAPTGMGQIQGFPVEVVVYSNQKPSMVWTVVKVENKSLDAGLFTLPDGLKKMEMPSMPSGAPPRQ